MEIQVSQLAELYKYAEEIFATIDNIQGCCDDITPTEEYDENESIADEIVSDITDLSNIATNIQNIVDEVRERHAKINENQLNLFENEL